MGNKVTVQSDDDLTVDVIELWTRPLNSVLAATFGGVHSFVVLKLSNKTYRMLEKHHDGTVELTTMTRRQVIDLALKSSDKALGFAKIKRACVSSSKELSTVKSGVTLGSIRTICEAHFGIYDIHTANCHRLSSAVWNSTVKEQKQTTVIIQEKLSKFASLIGIGASVRQDASREKVVLG